MKDSEGWPLVADQGQRVQIRIPGLETTAHKSGCDRVEGCGCPKSPVLRHGRVKKLVPAGTAPGAKQDYLEVEEYLTFNILTPSPRNVRVMSGMTDLQRQHEALVAELGRGRK